MNRQEAVERYKNAIVEDVYIMLRAGIRYGVHKDAQTKNDFDTQFVVALNPADAHGDAVKQVEGCEYTRVGKFWYKEHAEIFAEAMNNQVDGTL